MDLIDNTDIEDLVNEIINSLPPPSPQKPTDK